MSLHRSQHEEFENQPDELEREEMISRPRRKSRKKIIFFWILLILVIVLGIGGHVLHEHYLNARKAADSVYAPNSVKKQRDVDRLLKEGKPISILLMGTDTGALGRSFKGRTDTMMVCVLNPKDKTMTLVSLPRDALVAINGYEQYYPSKLNSAYAYGGSATAVKTVQKYLNVPIDFYATINMGGLEGLINAVGGVDIKPLLSFSFAGYNFVKGKKTHMDGTEALQYCRMRDQDPLGDYGRQNRQRQVIMALAFKGVQLTSLLNDDFLNSLSKQLRTDLSFNNMVSLNMKYRVATHHMKSTHLQGTTQVIGEADFEVASRKNKQEITDVLRKALDLPHAETGDTLKGTDLESPSQLEGTENSNDTTTSTGQTYQTYQTPQYQGQY
ncbi:LCP family glycopolymer transferase [Ligilactobacillus aviarius]|uniref:LCP family glycopolymer transferase n=1 Tax=Ligilactobacillus aviarius TaxID=1606 RepID=UPI0007D8F49C|nr:LytR family transcriptional regulator [Ligilactobacillus aviarius]